MVLNNRKKEIIVFFDFNFLLVDLSLFFVWVEICRDTWL